MWGFPTVGLERFLVEARGARGDFHDSLVHHETRKWASMSDQKPKKGLSRTSKAAPLSLSVADIKELFILMRENEIAELNIEQGETKIHIVSSHPSVPAAAPPVVSVVPGVAPVGVVAPAAQQPVVSVASSTPSVGGEVADAEAATAPEKEPVPANVKTITSPMVGTFYRAPAPDAPPFVEVGDRVKEDTTLCIIEAMKLMNEIKAEVRGKVAKILVENGVPVEYNQPLFLIELE